MKTPNRSIAGTAVGVFTAGPHGCRPVKRVVFLQVLLILLSAWMYTGCAPGARAKGPPFQVDLQPPVLTDVRQRDSRTLVFVFDEAARAGGQELRFEPPLAVGSTLSEGSEIVLTLAEDQAIGVEYTLRMDVSDRAGNSLSFVYAFSGWNPRVPEILINELNPRGSGGTPDCVELFALSGGNLGGLRLTVGTVNRFSEEFVFPAVEITKGDFILVHAKAEGIPEERDETGVVDISGGRLASDTARDFWIPGAPGLPGNNGAVTLYARRNGPVIDAVLWSDRTADPDSEKLGWTSDGWIFAQDLGQAGAWKASQGTSPSPSDAVDVSASTSTRSLCRASIPADTDSRADWHTVPTRGQTFGTVNSDDTHMSK